MQTMPQQMSQLKVPTTCNGTSHAENVYAKNVYAMPQPCSQYFSIAPDHAAWQMIISELGKLGLVLFKSNLHLVAQE